MKLKNIGPGAMVAAAFIGPGTIATATMAGSSYGYTLLWAVVFSAITTYILQEMSARLGIVANKGVGEAIRAKVTHPVAFWMVAVLVISAIFVGNAAYEAGNLVGGLQGFNFIDIGGLGDDPSIMLVVFAVLAGALLFTGKYKVVERILTALVATMGMCWIAVAVWMSPDWGAVLEGMFIPDIPEGAGVFVVGIIGTTVVPYNLFLHAASVQKKWQGVSQLSSSRRDAAISILGGGLITCAILIAVAAEPIPSDLSQAPGDFDPLIGFGYLAAGLTSAITAPLAAAFAVSEVLGWGKDMASWRFRVSWLLVLMTGLFFGLMDVAPVKLILFAQVVNGMLLPLLAILLLWIMNDRNMLGEHRNKLINNILGVLIVIITSALGVKAIGAAFGLW